MIRLFGLELHRNPIKKYLLAVILIAMFLLGMIYLIASVPHKQGNNSLERELLRVIAPIFSNYHNLAALTNILSMTCFTVFSAMIYNQFIINEFKGKRFYLLLSYPIKKSTIFLIKVIASLVVSISAMLVCNLIVFSLFYYAETLAPVVMGDRITADLFFDTAKLSILLAVITAMISLIAMRIGFLKKSTHITLIVSFAGSVMLSNFLGASVLVDMNAAMIVFVILAVVLSITASILIGGILAQVNRMEGE